MNTPISGHYPSSYFYMPALQPEQQQQQIQQKRLNTPPTKMKLKNPSFEIKTSMDLCNLYIKGLKPGLTSSDLFNLFEPFGRIISAKVMEDNTGATKAGFGFVSFSSSLEAAKALTELYVEPEKKKNDAKEKKNSSNFVMNVRFHEPRVPRPEHHFDQQLNLLSNSTLGAHFYTRQKNKIVSLQPVQDDSLFTTTSSYTTTSAMTSPTSPSFFTPTAMINSNSVNSAISTSPTPSSYFYYHYPSYWTDQQGVIYTTTDLISSSPPPSDSQMPEILGYQIAATHQGPNLLYHTQNKKKHHQHHLSWNGNMTLTTPPNNNTTTTTAASTSNKLVKLLESEYNFTSKEEPELVKELLRLNKTEQANCLNNSVYFKKKISDIMNEVNSNTK